MSIKWTDEELGIIEVQMLERLNLLNLIKTF
jgi:hypothetical protein